MRADWKIVSLLIGIIFICGCQNYTKQDNLIFTTSGCSQENMDKDGQIESSWMDDSTLKVSAIVVINCGESVEEGYYEVTDSTLKLIYKSPKCKLNREPYCKDCLCPEILSYTINNIPKKQYSFELVRNN